MAGRALRVIGQRVMRRRAWTLGGHPPRRRRPAGCNAGLRSPLPGSCRLARRCLITTAARDPTRSTTAFTRARNACSSRRPPPGGRMRCGAASASSAPAHGLPPAGLCAGDSGTTSISTGIPPGNDPAGHAGVTRAAGARLAGPWLSEDRSRRPASSLSLKYVALTIPANPLHRPQPTCRQKQA